MNTPHKTIAILQARMGSSRLSGKMMALLDGRPLIDFALERLCSERKPGGVLDQVVLATSIESNNDPMVEHVRAQWPDVVIVRGSEENVLERFLTAIETTGADYFIRATGDCPFINIEAMRNMLGKLIESGADIVNYQAGYEYVDKGTEAVSAKALLRAAKDPELTEGDREHVTSFLYRNADRFSVQYIPSAPELRRGDIRLTIDTPEDMEFFQELLKKMRTPAGDVSLREIVTLLDQYPELPGINIYSSRKCTRHERARLGFRCDGGVEIGLGHIVGCIRMAKLLAAEAAIGIEFVVRENPAAQSLISKAGFPVEVLPAAISPEEDIAHLLEKKEESDWGGVLINFCKRDLDRYTPFFGRIKESGLPLIFMDNPVPPSYLQGDLLINALPHPDYKGYKPEEHPACFDGLEYFLAGRDKPSGPRPIRSRVERVLIAMGGADQPNVSSRVLRALAEAGYKGYADIILGAACPHYEAVKRALKDSGLRGAVNRNVSDLYERMLKADVGFSALGLTTYEMAFTGLPVCIISNSSFNGAVADIYVGKYKTAWHLGCQDQVTCKDITFFFRRIVMHQLSKVSHCGMSIGSLSHTIVKHVAQILKARNTHQFHEGHR